MSKFKDFTISTPRPLPVIVLADISGSMSVDGKIDVLNSSIEAMARDFASQDDRRGEIQVAVIAFGGDSARLIQAPVAAAQLQLAGDGSKRAHSARTCSRDGSRIA